MFSSNYIKVEIVKGKENNIKVILSRKYDRNKENIEEIEGLLLIYILRINDLAEIFGSVIDENNDYEVPLSSNEISVHIGLIFKNEELIREFIDSLI